MSKISNYEEGFTLVELLIATGIAIVVGSIIVAILVATLRNSSKSAILNAVRQNGDYTLSQMVRTIRGAKSLNSQCLSSPPPTSITITKIDNTQVIYDCSGTTITENGSSLLDTNIVTLVANSCSLVCNQQNASDYPIIQISFSIKQKNASTFAEQSTLVSFQTSVIMRNINR